MFAERLKKTRIKRGYTQQETAEALNLSVRSYQRYEALNGQCEPPLNTLVSIADLFNVSIDYLLGRDDFLQSLGVYAEEQ